MFKTFQISFRLKNTYRANGIIYSLKSIPLVKKLLPDSLYASRELKTFANVLSGIIEVFNTFVWKVLYLLLMVYLPSISKLMTGREADHFLHIFFFLTLIGGILNTKLFDPSKDKYYAIFLMRQDAKEFTLTDFYYFLGKNFVGLMPSCLIFGILANVPWYLCVLLPVDVVSIKLVLCAIRLHQNASADKVQDENHPGRIQLAISSILLLLAYVLPYFGCSMNPIIFVLFSFASIVGGFLGYSYLCGFCEYRRLYKKMLTPETFAVDPSQAVANVTQQSTLKQIDFDGSIVGSSKSGYEYFNDIFIQRHRKLLTRSANRITIISAATFLIILGLSMFFQEIKEVINHLGLTFLPYFLFVMYMINRGKVITQAMFMNCDHSMLSYRFYRQPKVILSLFWARLKSIILINLPPAFVIGLSLPILLYATGGTENPLNYVILFVSILAMSIFFSVHNMVLYYLLQPYNSELKMKNPTFSLANSLTYIICYVAIGKQAPTLIFGAAISFFCILYCVLALLLAYRLAPKTFKLRQ